MTETFSPEPEPSEGELPREDLFTAAKPPGDSSSLPIGDQPPLPEERREPPSSPESRGEPPLPHHPEDPPVEEQPPVGDPMPSTPPVGDPPSGDRMNV